MLAMEELLCELTCEEINEQGLPPGFRFHPTDEELITFYLASKVFNGSFCGIDIAEVDLNRCEPWELPDVAKMGEREWYFFSLRDRKYPTGLRTNRATGAGYWKATGKDREVYSASSGAMLGLKKTLVFYKGRAPRGEKTKWVMHEYRLDGDFSFRHSCKEEWVICRIFHKKGRRRMCFSKLNKAIITSWKPLLQQIQSNAMPINGFQPCFSPTTSTNKNTGTNSNSQSPSMLFKSSFSYQDCKQSGTNYKQCNTEANFSHFQFPDAHLGCVDKIVHPNPHQNNPSFFEMGCGGNILGFSESASAADTIAHDMSTSIAFSRAGLQMMLDTPIRLPGESWPFDP
ncbi:hypothetical protein OIU84_006999 [Salix udensis]|uniref:NAC domain-containing protein n=1 Tax=Salix udensis TaxID=889485 RepID=A0AAD6JZL7_9ROSI|nr:hypothetical protein OIU84_006999 [Salix udensis]